MKKYVALYAVAFSAVLMVVACGDTENVTETHRTTGYTLIPDGSFVSDYDCDSSVTGKLLYSESFKSVYLCDGSSWNIINGKDGTNGKDGKDGTNGKDGVDGKDGTNGSRCIVNRGEDKISFYCGGDSSTVTFEWDVDEGCRIASTSDTLIVLECDGDTVNVPNSLDGKRGRDCTLEKVDDETYKQICGDSVVTFRTSFAKNDTLSVVMCGERIYDAVRDTCIGEVVFGRCDGELYDKSIAFCTNDTVYAMCGDEYYNTKSEECENGIRYSLCNGVRFLPITGFCRDGVILSE